MATQPRNLARRVTCCTALLTLAAALAATSASAQSAADKATAEQLFTEARTLMAARQFQLACPKLEASLKLDAALGTRLNLASCYEEVGKLASAWGMYHEAADLAAKEHQPRRVKFALDHAGALEPRLPRVVIEAPVAGGPPGLTVTRDGTVIDATVFGTSIYVDPGPRTIVAVAPGYRSSTVTITAVEGQEHKVALPVLEAEPTPVVVPASVSTAAPSRGADVERLAPAGDRGRTRRLVGLASGGVGLAATAVGLGVGYSAKRKWDQAFDDQLCTRDTHVCTAAGQTLTSSARTRATIATVTVSIGAALVVTGAVLYFTAPSRDRRDDRRARLVPAAGRDTAGVALLGQF